MKTFHCSLNIERDIEAEDEHQANSIFMEELEESSNMPLSVIISQEVNVIENKTKKLL